MKGLNRTQLKTIAIIAMVCDHIAWGFLDFLTPLAQFLHVIGRLTIPIMCFFVAEGYRRTSNIKAYVLRMVVFWLISIVPFYMFFYQWYGYRQNIIFDLLLGLLLLIVLDNKILKPCYKIMLTVLLFSISILIGGWVIFPLLCVLVFYYKKTFKAKAIWFSVITVTLVIFLMVTIALNQIYHFSNYDWLWYEKTYFLGFLLAIPLLKLYNGERGAAKYSNYLFYCFYPLHFYILAAFKTNAGAFDVYHIYVGMQILVIALGFGMLVTVARSRPSKAQSASLILSSFSIVYMIGFLIEITGNSLEVVSTAIKIEYFGECILIMGFTWFISEFFHIRFPVFIYVIEGLIACMTMFCMFTLDTNQLFYTSIAMDYSGPFPRVDLAYGIGFYLFTIYLGIVNGGGLLLGIYTLKNSTGIERKRIRYMLLGFIGPWAAYILRGTGITGGYEISSLGILCVIVFFTVSWIKYGYFDSVQLAAENALNHGKEGVMVISTSHRILYFNQIVKELFYDVKLNRDVYLIGDFRKIFEGSMKSVTIMQRIYELRTEPLIESGFTQGYMLWVIDMTKHFHELQEIQNIAHTDSLTGLHNRSFFQTSLMEHLQLNGTGAMVMMDLDNFKSVNDTYGHGIGDNVLKALGDVIKEIAINRHLTCRIGGDEFCMFFKDITDKDKMSQNAVCIQQNFLKKLESIGYPSITGVSIGIALTDTAAADTEQNYFKNLYQNADKALYLTKNNGKGTYNFY